MVFELVGCGRNCNLIICAAIVLVGLGYITELVNAEYNCEYKKDGFYSDEDFCHIYWRCNYGVAEEYECPAGTAWNHLESRCDWLDNVDCTRVKEKEEKKDEDEEEAATTEESSKKKKTKKITTEKEDTTTVATESPDDLHKIVDLKDLGLKAILKSLHAIPESEEKLPAQKPKQDDDDQQPDYFDYHELCDNLTVPTTFRDDPFICNRYIRCNHGYAQKFKCSKNTAWDTERSICLWSDYVDCGSRVYVTDEGLLGENDSDEKVKFNVTRSATRRPNVTTSDPFTSPADKPNQNVNDPKALCQSFGSYYIPDNTNCASYYMCNNGKETKMSCGDKQLFNSESTTCEEFTKVFCGNRPVNLADRNQCTGKRDGIYPDLERSCKVFYQCINQVKVREASCPNNLRFNSVNGRCDNPINIIAPCGAIGAANDALALVAISHRLLSSVLILAIYRVYF